MRRSLRSWLWQVPIDREIEEELAFHLDMRTRELIEQGLDPVTAREIALARIGDLEALKRKCLDLARKREREARLTRFFEELLADTRFAIRQMRASPAFTLVVVFTLALGIGANAAMFALADATFLRPLPFAESDRLVRILERRSDGTLGSANPLDFFDWHDRSRTFSTMAAATGSTAAVTGPDGIAEQVPALVVTREFFDVLGVSAVAGRTFQPEDDIPAPAVALLSEEYWRSRFHGDQALIGSEVRIGGQSVTILGIVPVAAQIDFPGTNATGETSVWRLFSTPKDRTSPAQRNPHYLQVIGRLAPGVTIEDARSDIESIADTLAQEWAATNHGHGVAIQPLRDALIGSELRLTSWLLLGVVGFVLLLCCANVANLIMARMTARTRELAVRSAIGAGRNRIVRQLLTEGLVLAVLSGLVGGGLGVLILEVVPSLLPSGLLPVTASIGFDSRVLTFCIIAAVAMAIACSVIPAWQVTGVSLVEAVSTGGHTTSERGARLRTAFAIAEVAVAVPLLCGAGLLLRTLVTLDRVDSGAGANDGLTMVVNFGISENRDAMRQYYAALEREVGAVPGVHQVAIGSAMPLDGLWHNQPFKIVGDRHQQPAADGERVGYQIVSASYFETLDIPIRKGRGFTSRDTVGGAEVCIVNEAFVRQYLSGREPLGVQLAVQAMTLPPRDVVREIVGVVAHVLESPGQVEERPHVYVPIAQDPWWTATLSVRPGKDVQAVALVAGVRAAVARVDNARPGGAIRTLEDIAAGATARPRFRATLVTGFAGLALALALTGVFSVLAYSVQQRMREFGVRLALGATAGDVFWLVLRRAVRIAAAGTAIGLVAAAFLNGAMSAVLFGVRPLDPATFAATAVTTGFTVIAATVVPALRAARIDPAVACRNE